MRPMTSNSPSTSMVSLKSDKTHSLRSGCWLSKCPSPSQNQVALPDRLKLPKEQGFTTVSFDSPTQATPRESVWSQVFARDGCKKAEKKKAGKIIAGHKFRLESSKSRHGDITVVPNTSRRKQTCGQAPPTTPTTPPHRNARECKKYTLFNV